MALKYGKTEIKKISAVLDAEYETVGEAAQAALLAAEEIFRDRAKFVVVGQLTSSPEHGTLDPRSPEAVMVSLGWYSTEGDAKAASESLWHSLATGETFRTLVLPVHHGTPAEFHRDRKQVYEKKRADAQAKKQQEIQDFIKRQEERNARLSRGEVS